MFSVRFLLLAACLSLFFSCSLCLNDAVALLTFKNLLVNAGPALTTWKEGSNPCVDRWRGIFCDKNAIIHLHLPRLGLSGLINVNALGQIRSLRTISLMNNSFTGPIPNFNRIKNLKALYLSGNRFTGEISNEYFAEMGHLTRVWLSYNNFTGKIPKSLAKLPHLHQLHLENNKFLGQIPNISQTSLNQLNLSNNNLEGKIPENMTRFGAKAFAGNPKLCGEAVAVDCPPSPSSAPQENQEGESGAASVFIMVGIVVAMTILLFVNTRPKNNDNHDDSEFDTVKRKSTDNDGVVVRVNDETRPEVFDGARIKRAYSANMGGLVDFVMVNEEKGVFGFADLMKAAAEVLGGGGLGSAYKAGLGGGVTVVVKRVKRMNRLGRGGFDDFMKRIGKIRHPNILTPLAYHYREEEKLVIFEFVPMGSLMFVMHGDRGPAHADLTWPTRLKIVKGIASGMRSLHRHFASCDAPHGNLKSSNVLLNDNYDPLLTDFAFLPSLEIDQAMQALFAFKTPEALSTKQVSPKSDVYCLGIVILEVLTGKFPSQYHNSGNGGTDVVQWANSAIREGKEIEVLDPEIVSCTRSVDAMVQLLRLGATCTETDPQRRPTMEETTKAIEEMEVA